MSLAGAMGGHTVVAELLLNYGTQDSRTATYQRRPPGRSGQPWR